MLQRSLAPAVLVALVLTLIVAIRVTAAPAASKTVAAPSAAVAAAPVPAPVATPAVATRAARSVATPAVFANRAQGLSPKVLAMALDAVACAKARGTSGKDDLLTVIDYSLPSTTPRLWVLDLAHGEVLYHELVAHGSGSGENYATRFSNTMDSRQTSLGLFLTGGTYEGGNGYSMVLKGLDEGVNDRAEQRHIVMHGAWYVSADHVRSQGRLGRSWGCPALSEAIAPTVIDAIKGGSFVFSYSGQGDWYRKASSSLSSCAGSGSNGSDMAGGVSAASAVTTAATVAQ